MNKSALSQTCLYNISYKKSFTLYLQVAIEGICMALVQHNTSFATVHSQVTVGGN